MARKHCPTGKNKYFNEPWAKNAAEELTERLGGDFRPYHCSCGWWHTFDKAKKRQKDNQIETRSQRRRRIKRGEPPPRQVLQAQRHTAYRRRKRWRRQARIELPLRVWEDDGGAFYPEPDPEETP